MSRETPQTENLTRYLLGELPEAERERLEDAFLGDEGLFQLLSEAENDLLDDYVGGRLSAPVRERFERHYLHLPGSRERLHTARHIARERAALAAAAASESAEVVETRPAPRAVVEPERPGFRESLRAFWRGAFPSMTPYAMGLAVLALAVGGVWWAATRGAGSDDPRAPELAETRTGTTPSPVVEATPTPAYTRPDANANTLAGTQNTRRPEGRDGANEPPRAPREAQPGRPQTPAPPRAEPRHFTVLALVAGLTRGEGAANRLVVPKGAGAVRLEFGLGDGGYKDVRATLRTVEGREVWKGSVAPPRAGDRAALTLPARLFSDEDYLLTLSGTDATGERVEFQEFYLNAEVR